MLTRAWVLAVVVLSGCSSILGLKPPQERTGDAGGSDAGGGDSGLPDFTIAVTTAAPRVPQDGSDFIDVAITRTNLTAPIAVSVPTPPTDVTVTAVTIDGSAAAGSLVVAGDAELPLLGSGGGANEVLLHIVATADGIEHDVDVTAVVTLRPGIPDPNFGSAGTGEFTLQLNGGSTFDNEFFDVAFGSNGTLTLAGDTQNSLGAGDGIMIRLTSSGAPDAAFHGGTALEIDQHTGTAPGDFYADSRQSDGHVIGVGQTQDQFTKQFPAGWVASVTAAGSEESDFGDLEGGNDFVDSSQAILAVEVQTGDSLVMVGGDGPPSLAASTVIMRQTPIGASDGTYAGGSALPLGVSFAGAGALALDPSGTTAYVVGTAGGSAGAELLHITSAGALDPAFGQGSGRFALGSAAAAATAIAVQPDGKLVVAGAPTFIGRVLPGGGYDASFGTLGIATLPTSFSSIAAVGIQTDGRIVVAGAAVANTVTVLRLLPDGTLDPTYGTGGSVTITLGADAVLHNMRLQPDNSAVLVGAGGSNPSGAIAAVVRVTP
jgi:uncharacterized delta-60 repeat protein